MKINIICVGNIKDKFYTDACEEYIKRLSKFHTTNIIEVNEEKLAKNANFGDIEVVKNCETERIKKMLKGHVVLLDIKGKSYSSEEFALKLQDMQNTTSTVTFVIGGSFGVSDKFRAECDDKVSFSKFTFPHQLMRVILLEQLYRATTILHNITYHK